MANWLTYRIKVGDDVLVLADEEAQELIKNETERSKKADAQTASFLESTTTNGIIRNSKSDPFGQTAIGGMKVVIDKGDLIINGNIKNHARLTRTYNVTQENRTEVFLYRFDSVTNEITGLWRDCIIQGDIILSREDKTELPLRSSGYYDILICKITIPAGATEITQDMIGDFRQNEYYCGYAKNILVEIDETLTKSDAAADAAAVGTVIGDLRNETRTRDIITEKRITNLEAGLPAERWSVDDSVAYTKDVPENALPFASVDMIGGMTRKCTNLVNVYAGANTTVSNGVVTQVNADTAINPYIKIQQIDSSGNVVAGESIGTIALGVVETTFELIEGVVQFCFGLNGSAVDTLVKMNVEGLPRGTYTYSCEFTNITQGSVSWRNNMLNSGSIALPYEPYFDGLRSAPVTEVESVGVNLFDISNAKPDNCTVNNGVVKQTNADDATWLSFKLQTTINGSLVSQIDTITVSTAGKVVFSFTKDNTFNGIAFGLNGSSIDTMLRVSVSNLTNGRTYYLSFDVTNLVQGSVSWGNIMLNRGTTAIPYTPYRSDTLPIPAAVQALDGYGWGVNDKIYNYIDWEKKQFVKRVEKVVFDGSNDETIYPAMVGADFTIFTVELSGAYSYSAAITNYYIPYAVSWDTTSAHYYVSMDSVVLVLPNSQATSIETLRTYLAENPMTVYYELAEPVITDISALLPDDNLIGVVGGGTVTPVNKHGYAVPSKITYQLKGAEA